MMKFKFFLLISVLFVYFSIQAKKVDVRKAESVAVNLIQSENRLKKTDISNVKLVHTAERVSIPKNSNSGQFVYYYVFDVGNDSGYIIVAGDDLVVPVLGYSVSVGFDPDNLPPNLNYWLSELQREIDFVADSRLPQNEECKKQWEAYLTGDINSLRSGRSAEPLLKTNWYQSGAFSSLCPFESSGLRTVTGCVATAMAQIMKFYEWPKIGIEKSESYVTSTSGLEIPSVDFSVEYKWDLMADTYPVLFYKDPENAVSTLMYHCGVSVKTDYNSIFNGGSGAENMSPAKAWVTYFDYDAGIQSKQRTYYSDSQWDAMLMNEIDAGRPVYYSGTDENKIGHAFICDGYDDFGLFHFNWGWEGTYNDAYFVSTVLNPGSGNLSAGSGVYNNNHAIIVNVAPNTGGKETYEIKLKPGTNLFSSAESVAKGEIFTVTANFENAGVTDFEGTYGVVLVDDSDNIVEAIGFFEDEILLAGYLFDDSFSILCAVPENISAGNYRISAAVKPVSGDWMIIGGDVNAISYLPLGVSDDIVSDESNLVMYNELGSQGLIINSPLVQGSPVEITVGLWNRGYSFVGELDLGLYSFDGELMQLIEKRGISIGAENIEKIRFTASKILICGNYKLALYAKSVTGVREMVSSFDTYLNNIDVTIESEPTSLTGIKDNSFCIYPNPVDDVLNVSIDDSSIESIYIFDLSGRLMKGVSTGSDKKQISIPVNDLSDGMYFVNIRTQGGIITEKIMKK